MKFKINRIAALLLSLLLICIMGGRAYADVPDLYRECSVTFSMHYGETPVGGGSLSIYRVAEATENNGDFSFQFTVNFAACGESLDNLEDAALAESLRAYAQRNSIAATATANIDYAGNVSFTGLRSGLYLVVQHTPASRYEAISPFLFSLPYLENGVYKYDLTSEPKTELETKPAPPPPPVPPAPPFPFIPQTGQLWWPVPALVCLGLAFTAIGFALKRRVRKDEDQAYK